MRTRAMTRTTMNSGLKMLATTMPSIVVPRPRPPMLECVINVSEGSDRAVVDRLAAAGGRTTLDVHSDPGHNRSVLTLAGP
ncbi:MAG: hypothetical protein ACRDXE_05155, partial [Acidimicrobiales bacterium]